VDATCELVQLGLAAEARSCAGDELGRSEAQFPSCVGYESNFFLGGLYPDPNHEPPPELQPPLPPGFKVQRHTGLEAAAGKAFERLEPGVTVKVSFRLGAKWLLFWRSAG
jgi:hypothetical protein